MTDVTNFVAWDELKGKEARGVSNDVDLGEVNEIGRHYIVTQKRAREQGQVLYPEISGRKV